MGNTGIPQKIIDRFCTYFRVGSPDECWLWTAGCFKNGYGQFRVGRKKWKAHRLAYFLMRGPILSGMCVLHDCDNPPCCNPSHLFIGTHADNAKDRDQKGRGGDGGSALKKRLGIVQGIKNAAAVLTEIEVREIRQCREMGHTFRSIGEMYNISASQACNIWHGRCWAHVKN